MVMVQKIAISATEHSADLLGAILIAALAKNQLTFFGLAGQKMQTAGCKKHWDLAQVNVMGFSEVLKKLPSLWRLRKQMIGTFIAEKPACFIGIDAPDFHFFIEKKLKSKGIKTVHFVSPSFWAWRIGRVRKMKKNTDLVLCLFPFEVDFYRQHQILAVFVGHPLAQTLPQKPLAKLAQKKTQQVLLMPGSRATEVQLILPTLLATLPEILSKNTSTKFVLTLADEHYKQWAEVQVAQQDIPVKITSGDSHQQLLLADLVLIASGTATLEAMMIGVPMVVVYKVTGLTYWLAKRLLRTKWVSLPNILAQKAMVPELLQQAMTKENISYHANQLLKTDNTELLQCFFRLRQSLQADTASIIRKNILQCLNG